MGRGREREGDRKYGENERLIMGECNRSGKNAGRENKRKNEQKKG